MTTRRQGMRGFDHGCQFFRAGDPRMKAMSMAPGWPRSWQGRFGASAARPFAAVSDADIDSMAEDFSAPGSSAPVYAGVGGMQRLPRAVLDASGATVRRGVRVKQLVPLEGRRWELLATSGEGAYHDTSAAAAEAATEASLGIFDAVVLTDVRPSTGRAEPIPGPILAHRP